jgi:hypothetical protein
MPVEPRVLDSPNSDFLKRYGLNNKSHPLDWLTAFMPPTPNANKEDPVVANVKGDCRTKFAVSNGTVYVNTKATLNGASEEDHIFAGKHHPFTNRDIVSMLGVNILDGLAPLPQLVQKMQLQSKQLTHHGNNRVAAALGTGYQQKHCSF